MKGAEFRSVLRYNRRECACWTVDEVGNDARFAVLPTREPHFFKNQGLPLRNSDKVKQPKTERLPKADALPSIVFAICSVPQFDEALWEA